MIETKTEQMVNFFKEEKDLILFNISIVSFPSTFLSFVFDDSDSPHSSISSLTFSSLLLSFDKRYKALWPLEKGRKLGG